MPHITEYMSTDEVAVILEVEKWEVGILLGRHLHCRFEAGQKLSRGRSTYHLNNHENIIFGEFVWDYLKCDACTQHRTRRQDTRGQRDG